MFIHEMRFQTIQSYNSELNYVDEPNHVKNKNKKFGFDLFLQRQK